MIQTISPNNIKPNQGFTIVELLIVIIVIGILATLVLIAYGNVQGQARDTKRQSNAQSVANASEHFKIASTQSTYPRLDTGANFNADVANSALYANGAPSISVDSSVTTSGATSLLSTITTVPTHTTGVDNANNGMNLKVYLCPAGATSSTATGMKIYYYSESLKDNTKFIQSGSGC